MFHLRVARRMLFVLRSRNTSPRMRNKNMFADRGDEHFRSRSVACKCDFLRSKEWEAMLHCKTRRQDAPSRIKSHFVFYPATCYYCADSQVSASCVSPKHFRLALLVQSASLRLHCENSEKKSCEAKQDEKLRAARRLSAFIFLGSIARRLCNSELANSECESMFGFEVRFRSAKKGEQARREGHKTKMLTKMDSEREWRRG